jgi:precorrin-6A/cobalt-precorrin-6A reductase
MPERILILGGTTEARHIADALVAKGHHLITSLAGVTTRPLLPSGSVRIGGFGGADGLRRYIAAEKISQVIDATHPFAAIISRNAQEAVQGTEVKMLRFERPAWVPHAEDTWIFVQSLPEAAQILPSEARVFLTTGRKELEPFLQRLDLSGLIRTVEAPAQILPGAWTLLLDRPPHHKVSELVLLRQHAITHLVSKNAGSAATYAKLEAARDLGLPVIMIERPLKPACETFSTVQALVDRL